ncbi:PREDICTED: embryonic stem cell-related gene protein-like [Rhinopithecus bieti]|uniref:embryonic stem cell-related gene protein-like n=1 Tax=Rhinopithecus bieti TaxID=61621 RepID=UPI00083C69BD|nr:PREDICTED: embryonic stem cell-related gene protein-like [Rhinopithecus bieti]
MRTGGTPSDSARMPSEINSLVAHTKLFGGLFTWTRVIFGAKDPGQRDSFRRPVPCPHPNSVKRFSIRPRVLRPTSPRNISPILNRAPTGGRTV